MKKKAQLMKKLKLCLDCDIKDECKETCAEALKWEKDRPDKAGRSPDKYKPIGMSHSWTAQKGK